MRVVEPETTRSQLSLAWFFDSLSPRQRQVLAMLLVAPALIFSGCRRDQETIYQDFCEQNANDALCGNNTWNPTPLSQGGTLEPATPGFSSPETGSLAPGGVITVRKGDTFFGIAKRLVVETYPTESGDHYEELVHLFLYHFVSDKIMQSNGFVDPTLLPVGTVLNLPEADTLDDLYREAQSEATARFSGY